MSKEKNTKITLFQTRLKELYKNLDNDSKKAFKEDVLRNKDRYYNLVKAGTNSPHVEEVRNIANFFNVDVGYLYGDWNYPRMASLTLSELSQFSNESCDALLAIASSEPLKDVFEKMLQDKNFEKLLLEIYYYSHSHNFEMTTMDKAKVFKPQKTNNPLIISGRYKSSVNNIFDKIIESIYESNKPEAENNLYFEQITELFTNIQMYKPSCTDHKIKKTLYQYVESTLSLIKLTKPDSIFLSMTPKEIIDNSDAIYQQITDEKIGSK